MNRGCPSERNLDMVTERNHEVDTERNLVSERNYEHLEEFSYWSLRGIFGLVSEKFST